MSTFSDAPASATDHPGDRPPPAVAVGFASEIGTRQRNEDFVAFRFGDDITAGGTAAAQDLVAVIADGLGGAKGGRVAAEVAVRGFLDGYIDQPEYLGIRRAAVRTLEPLNRWIATLGRTDPRLAGMGCTFTALILRRHAAHVIHIGDTRLYRLGSEPLARLTEDHAVPGKPNLLYRALGTDDPLRLDYGVHPVAARDRFLLTSDGVHGVLSDRQIEAIVSRRGEPEETARRLVAAALDAGGTDNATALVLDVIAMPPPERPGGVN